MGVTLGDDMSRVRASRMILRGVEEKMKDACVIGDVKEKKKHEFNQLNLISLIMFQSIVLRKYIQEL